jgi:hypothetical protein
MRLTYPPNRSHTIGACIEGYTCAARGFCVVCRSSKSHSLSPRAEPQRKFVRGANYRGGGGGESR